MTMRGISGKNQYPSIIILADAWTRSAFYEALRDGWLPEIQKILDSGGRIIPEVISGFPSVSLASHASLLTLSPPMKHGIPGHRWIDNTTTEPRNYIGRHCFRVNRDLSAEARTVFERKTRAISISIGVPTSRGAQIQVPLQSIDSKKILHRLANTICRYPDSISVAWLPRGDIVSHVHGPDSSQLLEEMRRTSKGLGNLVSTLSAQGLWGKSRFALVTDHGHRRVSHGVDLPGLYRDMGYSCRQNPSRLSNDDIAVFSNGDSAAYVYYSAHPENTERFAADTRRLVRQAGIGLSFVRLDAKNHLLLSSKGSCSIEVISGSLARYTMEEGADPIGLLTDARPSADIHLEQPLLTSGSEDYPDIIAQYLVSYVPDRSPSVLITAADNYHFGRSPRIGWRLGFHRGSHGGASSEEMLTAAVARGWAEGIDGPVRIQDFLTAFLAESGDVE